MFRAGDSEERVIKTPQRNVCKTGHIEAFLSIRSLVVRFVVVTEDNCNKRLASTRRKERCLLFCDFYHSVHLLN